jgi:hypothetical protein
MSGGTPGFEKDVKPLFTSEIRLDAFAIRSLGPRILPDLLRVRGGSLAAALT